VIAIDEFYKLLERVKQGMDIVDRGINTKGEVMTEDQLNKAILFLRKLMIQLSELGHELKVNWSAVLMDAKQLNMMDYK
jgi:hypothetical protein